MRGGQLLVPWDGKQHALVGAARAQCAGLAAIREGSRRARPQPPVAGGVTRVAPPVSVTQGFRREFVPGSAPSGALVLINRIAR